MYWTLQYKACQCSRFHEELSPNSVPIMHSTIQPCFLPPLLMLVMSHGPTLIDMWLEARKSLSSRQSEWRGGPKLCLYVIYEVLKRSSWYNSEENLVFLCLIWNCDEYVEFGRFEPARQCSEDGFVQQFFQLNRLKFRRKELFHFVPWTKSGCLKGWLLLR